MKYDSDNQRVHRIGALIQKEIAQVIHHDINDPRIKDVVITEVEMSKDLKHAKVFFLIFNHKSKKSEEIKSITKAINSSKEPIFKGVFTPKLNAENLCSPFFLTE